MYFEYFPYQSKSVDFYLIGILLLFGIGFAVRGVYNIRVVIRSVRKSPKALFGNTPLVAKAESGFALVIALGLMAFMLLLMMGLTAFIRVETQSASINRQQLEARQNALLGAMIAVGELQRTTGPDQRVTATAGIYDTQVETETVSGVNQPHWVGVWNANPGVAWLNDRYNSSDSYYNYAARRDGSDGRFIGWLVSGSQNNRNDVDFPATFHANESAELVGMDFDEMDPLQIRNRVRVEKVDIQGANGAAGGSYAFWVGDESAKARVDTFSENPGVADSLARRSRFMVNQRSGIEVIQPALDNPFADFSGMDTSFERAIFFDEILLSNTARSSGLAHGAQREFLNRHFHSLSIHNKSLLTNTLSGGLRMDLSAFLRNANADSLSPFSGLPAYFDGNVHRISPPLAGTANHPAPEGPSWEQLADYFQNRVDSGNALEIRKHTSRQSGIHPVITRFRLDIIPLFDRSDNPAAQGDDFYLYFAPLIVLNNTYDHPLTIPENSLWVHFLFEARDLNNERGVALVADWVKGYVSDSGATRLYEYFSSTGPSSNSSHPWAGTDIPNLMDNARFTQFTDTGGQSYRGVSFLLPPTTLAPGEVMSFGAANDGEDYSGDNLLEVGAFDSNPTAIRLLSYDANGDPLRASLEWSQALDDLPSRTRYRPTDNPSDVRYVEQGALHLQGDGPLPDSARLNPFLLTIGLAEQSTDVIEREDFLFLAEGVLSSNPNVNTRFASSLSSARNQRPTVAEGFDDYPAMSTTRAVRFDVALAGAFSYGLANDRTTAAQWSNNTRYGFLINGRWPSSPLWSYPIQRISSVDNPANPNFSYGAVASYSPFAESGQWNMHNPSVGLQVERAFWGTGVDFARGESQVALVGSVRESPSLISLGQLRHFPLSFDGLAAGSNFANGISPRRLGDSGQIINMTPAATALPGSPLPMDLGYVINDRLWDGFFFSGLSANVTDVQLNDWDFIPLNQRLRFLTSAQSSGLNDPAIAASALQIEGGFNVNSTSVGAWKTILAGANRLAFDPVAGTSEGNLKNPFSRTGFPSAGSGDNREERVSGFRELSETELQVFAEAIVGEVKRRGPFFSLADFVNRRLQPGNDTEGLFGTIEAAIRSTDLNNAMGGGDFTAADYPTGYTPPSGMIAELELGPLFEGLAQWLNQSDVLERIAPFITVRGDTFTVRAYGEVRDPGTGNVRSVARCELLVQRIYDYVDPTNSPQEAVLPFDNVSGEYVTGNLSTANEQFGRRYRIIQFKWL
jgi:hypothetical protein